MRSPSPPQAPPIAAIPTERAWICCQCEVVFDTAQVCPQCGSGQAIASMAAWAARQKWPWQNIADVVQELDSRSAVRAGR